MRLLLMGASSWRPGRNRRPARRLCSDEGQDARAVALAKAEMKRTLSEGRPTSRRAGRGRSRRWQLPGSMSSKSVRDGHSTVGRGWRFYLASRHTCGCRCAGVRCDAV